MNDISYFAGNLWHDIIYNKIFYVHAVPHVYVHVNPHAAV